jgi:pimeloyl-ACP methyl ester carboxylesterase
MEFWWPWLYGPLMRGFLDAGFAVVATDYIRSGDAGGAPVPGGKSEGAAVLAAARAAQNFSLAQASGPVIIAGHSQGGHAALFANWQTEHVDYFAPGVDVRGVVALAPPTFLDRIATLLLANPSSNPEGVRNLLITAGSWVRLYNWLHYPTVVPTQGLGKVRV